MVPPHGRALGSKDPKKCILHDDTYTPPVSEPNNVWSGKKGFLHSRREKNS